MRSFEFKQGSKNEDVGTEQGLVLETPEQEAARLKRMTIDAEAKATLKVDAVVQETADAAAAQAILDTLKGEGDKTEIPSEEETDRLREEAALINRHIDRQVASGKGFDAGKLEKLRTASTETMDDAAVKLKTYETADRPAAVTEESNKRKPAETPRVASSENKPLVAEPPKERPGVAERARVFVKQLFGRELSPEEQAQHINTLGNEFSAAMKQGNLDNVLKSYEKLNDERYKGGMNKERFSSYQEQINALTRKAVTEGDGRALDRVLKFNVDHRIDNGPSFTREELGLKEGEKVDPEISRVALKHLLGIIRSSFDEGNFVTRHRSADGLNGYKDRLDRWVGSGIVSREEVNRSSEVRNLMRKEIVDMAKRVFGKDFSGGGNPANHFEKYLDKIADTGVYSKQEVLHWKKIERLTGF